MKTDEFFSVTTPRGDTSLALGFKSTKFKGTLSDVDRVDALRIFVQEALRVLATTGRLNVDDRTVFVVRVPSGWNKKTLARWVPVPPQRYCLLIAVKERENEEARTQATHLERLWLTHG